MLIPTLDKSCWLDVGNISLSHTYFCCAGVRFPTIGAARSTVSVYDSKFTGNSCTSKTRCHSAGHFICYCLVNWTNSTVCRSAGLFGSRNILSLNLTSMLVDAFISAAK